MKSLLIALYTVTLAAGLAVSRADDSSAKAEPHATQEPKPKRPALTEEQKTARKDLLAKYDANKDGKLDKDERKSITAEDKAKLRKAGLQARQRKANRTADKKN